MDHRNLLLQLSTQIHELMQKYMDTRVAKMFKKVNKLNYMFLNTYYKITNEMVNLKMK
jgi:hypothetical protein